jgi:uncharacterized membrane protein YphA (DoxX/SURF4 family)
MTNERILQITRVVLRVAVASAFLAAVADRVGFLGPYGSRNVSWGDWKHFEDYVAVLNWFVPKAWIPALSALETVIETGLGLGLLVGIFPRVLAWSSAVLLSSFALTMTIALGILAPLEYGVFTAVGAALLLGAVAAPRGVVAPEYVTKPEAVANGRDFVHR